MEFKFIWKDIVRYYQHPGDFIVMWPRAKEFGFRYYFDYKFRKTIKGRLHNRKYGNFLANKKSIKLLFIRQGRNKCPWCGRRILDPDIADLHHKIPISVQPKNNKLKNLLLIHHICHPKYERYLKRKKDKNKNWKYQYENNKNETTIYRNASKR